MFLEKGWLIFSGGGVRAKKFSRASFLRWWGQGQKVQNWCFLRWLGQGPKSVFSLDLLFLWRPGILSEHSWRIVSSISRISWTPFQIFGIQHFLIKKCSMILCVLGILLGTPCGLSKVCNFFECPVGASGRAWHQTFDLWGCLWELLGFSRRPKSEILHGIVFWTVRMFVILCYPLWDCVVGKLAPHGLAWASAGKCFVKIHTFFRLLGRRHQHVFLHSGPCYNFLALPPVGHLS